MLIGVCLMILIVLLIFSLILGESFTSISDSVGVDNTSLVNGSLTTYEIPSQQVIFDIDPIIGGIAIIVAIGVATTIYGAHVLATGLSPASVRTLTIITGYTGLWIVLSLLAIDLIKSIAIFGNIIYIVITLGYTIGVIQKVSGSDN